MKRLLLACLLMVSVCAGAQQRTVKVRLFWLHPPSRIRVEPHGAWLRACASCTAKKMTSATEFAGSSASGQTVLGQSRIAGEDFAPFSVDGELAIQPHDGVLLLTYTMPLEEYVAA